MLNIKPATVTCGDQEYFIELGKIKNAYLGREDHGIFTISLEFDFNGSGQSAGNMALNDPTALGTQVQKILDFFGGSWSGLIGRRAHVLRTDQFGFIQGLMNESQTKMFLFSDL